MRGFDEGCSFICDMTHVLPPSTTVLKTPPPLMSSPLGIDLLVANWASVRTAAFHLCDLST